MKGWPLLQIDNARLREDGLPFLANWIESPPSSIAFVQIWLSVNIVYYSIVYYLSDHAAGIAKLLSIDCSGSTHSTKGNITVEHYLPVMAGHTAPKLTMFPVPPG